MQKERSGRMLRVEDKVPFAVLLPGVTDAISVLPAGKPAPLTGLSYLDAYAIIHRGQNFCQHQGRPPAKIREIAHIPETLTISNEKYNHGVK